MLKKGKSKKKKKGKSYNIPKLLLISYIISVSSSKPLFKCVHNTTQSEQVYMFHYVL